MTPTATFSGIFVYNSCSNIGVSCLAGVANAGSTPRVFDFTCYFWNHLLYSDFHLGNPSNYGLHLSITTSELSSPNYFKCQQYQDKLHALDLPWANPGSATSWQVAVQAAGGGLPVGSGITTSINTNYPVSGLTAATAYEYYVRSDRDGTFSVWAGPFAFNTTVCDVAQQCNYTFTMNDSFGDGMEWWGYASTSKRNRSSNFNGTYSSTRDNTCECHCTHACDGLPSMTYFGVWEEHSLLKWGLKL